VIRPPTEAVAQTETAHEDLPNEAQRYGNVSSRDAPAFAVDQASVLLYLMEEVSCRMSRRFSSMMLSLSATRPAINIRRRNSNWLPAAENSRAPPNRRRVGVVPTDGTCRL
jgi:hypothetical protein